MGIIFHEQEKTFHLYNKEVSYIIRVMENGQLENLYYGKVIRDRESFMHLHEAISRPLISVCVPEPGVLSMEYTKQEYPVYGTGDYRNPALSILQENGSRIVNFTYVSHEIYQGKKSLSPLPAVYTNNEHEVCTLEICLHDEVINTDLILSYTMFEEYPVITRNAKLVHKGEESIVLDRALSMSVEFQDMDFEMVHLSGAWARERYVKERKLEMGIQAVQGIHGTAGGAEHNPFLALKRPDTTESQGEVYGFSLVYSGNFLAQTEVSTFDMTRVLMGIHPEGFHWKLETGESFQTPEVVMVYSDRGLNKMSQVYHRLYRKNLMRGQWKEQPRPILLNNWEATYFDFDADKIYHIAEEAKNIGLDMFVLDDGWFGKRDNDWCALGDWEVNEEKIKGGLPALAEKIHGLGLKFGLWVEPEMISEDSDLYREHPDWALKIPGRAMNRSRHQLNLDITRKEVREHIMKQIFKVLDTCKADYVKWDMNRSVDNVFSAALPKERQGEVYHRYVLAVYEMMESLVQRYPDLLFESCSGGGGRFEAGMLYYSPQIWCSDNTDAIDRLKIQYGTSFGYPISTMGAHVSVCPNHQSGRTTPFETRGIVASAGTFGYELDLMKMSEEEKKTAREQILKYKEMEHLVQSGDYYRLVNPFENNNHVLWQFVSKDKKETVVCGVRLHSEANPYIYLFYPQGLDADMKYEDTATGKVYTGAALMKAGLPLPLTTGDYQPIRFTFKAVEK